MKKLYLEGDNEYIDSLLDIVREAIGSKINVIDLEPELVLKD